MKFIAHLSLIYQAMWVTKIPQFHNSTIPFQDQSTVHRQYQWMNELRAHP